MGAPDTRPDLRLAAEALLDSERAVDGCEGTRLDRLQRYARRSGVTRDSEALARAGEYQAKGSHLPAARAVFAIREPVLVARTLFELELLGNPAIDEVIDTQEKHSGGTQRDEYFREIRSGLETLRSA